MGPLFTFSVQIDSVPDALDLEPDDHRAPEDRILDSGWGDDDWLDAFDWSEDDPDLRRGPVHCYVHGQSTSGITIRVSDHLTLDVEVGRTACGADWSAALALVDRAAELTGAILVEAHGDPDWDGPMDTGELRAWCNETWQRAVLAAEVGRLLAESAVAPVIVGGPIRPVVFGPRCRAETASGEDPADSPDRAPSVDSVDRAVERFLAIVRRAQYPAGPLFAAAAVEERIADGSLSRVAVIGPLLRTLLPPVDRLLVETAFDDDSDSLATLLIPADKLDSLPGISVKWLDDGHRIVEAIPEATWPAVVTAARHFG